MNLEFIVNLLTNHGVAAGVAGSLGLLNWWLLKKLTQSWESRLTDTKESLPVLKDVAAALDVQSKLLENFIAELRART